MTIEDDVGNDAEEEEVEDDDGGGDHSDEDLIDADTKLCGHHQHVFLPPVAWNSNITDVIWPATD